MHAAVLLGSNSTPTQCFRTLCLNLPVKNQEKLFITQKVLVTQSSNIVHCNWHTQKLYLQIFKPLWTLFCYTNWHFFYFLSGGIKQTVKIFTFCWFWLEKMHRNGLSGAFFLFEACQIHWCRFWVSTISSSWKIKMSGKDFTFC